MINFNNKEFIKVSTNKMVYSLGLNGTELINFLMVNSNIKPFSDINSGNLNVIEEQLKKRKNCKILIKFRRDADPTQSDFVYNSCCFSNTISLNVPDIVTKEATTTAVLRMITDTYEGTILTKANTLLLEDGKVNVYLDSGSSTPKAICQADSFIMSTPLVYNKSGAPVQRGERMFADFYIAKEDLLEMMSSDFESLTDHLLQSLKLTDSIKIIEANQEKLLSRSEALGDLIIKTNAVIKNMEDKLTSINTGVINDSSLGLTLYDLLLSLGSICSVYQTIKAAIEEK